MRKKIDAQRKAPVLAILIILEIAAVAAPLSLNKAAPISTYLMRAFGIGESQFGLLVSVFSVGGIVLAIPGGMLIRRFGAWKCVLWGLIALIAGALMGLVSGSFTLLLLSRIVEGVGMAFIAVAGPSIISATVSSGRRGVAMGFFSAYISIGQVLIFNLAPRMAHAGRWQNVWAFSALYAAAVAVLWALLMLKLGVFKKTAAGETAPARSEAVSGVLKNRSLWLLTAAVCLYNISYVSIQTYLPTYLSVRRGLPLATASSLVSVCCLTGTVFSIVAGVVSDRIGSRRVLGGVSLILSGGLFLLIPITPTSLFLPLLIILGMIPPVLPVCAFAAASEVIDAPEKAGVAMGLISMGQNIGFVAGPVLFGALVEGLSWPATFAVSAPVAVLGGLAMLLVKKYKLSRV